MRFIKSEAIKIEKIISAQNEVIDRHLKQRKHGIDLLDKETRYKIDKNSQW